MQKVTSFTKTNLQEIRTELDAHLALFEAKTGIKLSFGSISFASNEFTTTLKAVIANGKSDEELQHDEWNKHCYKFGLKPEQFGTEFEVKGETYTICGIKQYADRHGFPVLAKSSKSGVVYKFKAGMAHIAKIKEAITAI